MSLPEELGSKLEVENEASSSEQREQKAGKVGLDNWHDLYLVVLSWLSEPRSLPPSPPLVLPLTEELEDCIKEFFNSFDETREHDNDTLHESDVQGPHTKTTKERKRHRSPNKNIEKKRAKLDLEILLPTDEVSKSEVAKDEAKPFVGAPPITKKRNYAIKQRLMSGTNSLKLHKFGRNLQDDVRYLQGHKSIKDRTSPSTEYHSFKDCIFLTHDPSEEQTPSPTFTELIIEIGRTPGNFRTFGREIMLASFHGKTVEVRHLKEVLPLTHKQWVTIEAPSTAPSLLTPSKVIPLLSIGIIFIGLYYKYVA